MPRETDRTCDCGTIIRCTDARGGPVSYDSIYNEFHLALGTSAHVRLWYCFHCGGRLPESTRGRRFTSPSLIECEQVTAIIHRCRSAADLVREIGPGDGMKMGELTKWPPMTDRPWRRQFAYTRRWKTLVLLVIEYTDGSLSFGINGQPVEVEDPA
jgi:hypothetical protein